MFRASKARKRFAIAIATAFLLGGCATSAQRQYQAIVTNSQNASQQLQICVATGRNLAEFTPLQNHVPMNIDQATLEQLADIDKASDEAVQAILVTHPKFLSCRQSYLTQISQTTPTLVPIYVSLYAKGDGSLVDLIQKKQSWGEHLRRAKDASVEARLQISQENQRIAAGLNRSHEAELARRQAAANAMSQYLQTQQIINNMNRPVVTNCNQFGNMVNCVSR
jgi:hypothetical protein